MLDRFGVTDPGQHIARIVVDGIIVDDHRRARVLERIAEDRAIEALIVSIDSPGGTVVGGEALYWQLRRVSEKKPVVAVMREIATSAAYMAALGSDRIVARSGSITGSIGVIVQTTDITGLLTDVGIKTDAIKTSPLKAQPNPLEPLTPRAREAIEALIADVYDMFVKLVAARRGMQVESARILADGRVFTGSQAKDLDLIDDIGGEAKARNWLHDQFGLERDLAVRTFDYQIGSSLAETVLSQLGKTFVPERLRVDGLISLWHP